MVWGPDTHRSTDAVPHATLATEAHGANPATRHEHVL